ncbi:MAG: DUF3021 domain-containing protein [Lachnospiraceae bacterium]|nr:DUF3021 domain-containing protein [Lachnospiraceae bacterium]
MKRFRKYLSYEIAIDIKTCIYFFMILFYYFTWQIIRGSLTADIVLMVEMLAAAYVMGYIQMYLLGNFDEAEKLGKGEQLKIVLASLTYAVASYALAWFARNLIATVLFFLYMVLCYGCIFLSYKIKRDVDTAQLNRELEQFKKGKESDTE